MRIWYLNHYAKAPSHGSTGRAFFLARELKARGHDVLVVAAAQHHTRPIPAPPETWHRVTESDGIRFYHIPTRAYRGNGPTRLLNMLDFARGVRRLGDEVATGAIERPDVLIASCAHLFVYPPAHRAARSMGARIVFEVRDIWPLSLVEVAGMASWHPVIRWMGRIERKAYRTADAVVSLLPNALEHMVPLGLDPRKFFWIPNGVWAPEWDETPAPLPEEHRRAFEKVRAAGKLVVVYTGAEGPPNALDQLLDLDRTARGPRPYHFLLIGKGVQRDMLIAEASRRGIDFLTFLPYVPRTAVRTALRQADVCFIGWQKKRIYNYGISANKIFDYMMAGRPILHATDSPADPVREAGAGIAVPAYDPQRLEAALRRFAAMTAEERRAMGERGRSHVLHHHEWATLARRYEGVCRAVLEGPDVAAVAQGTR